MRNASNCTNWRIHSYKVTKIIAKSNTIAHPPFTKNFCNSLQPNQYTPFFTPNYFQLPMVFINFALNIHKTTIT